MSPSAALRDDVRTRLVVVAAGLLHDEGAATVTTRRVAEAAGVQAPTIYRLFGDKEGLLEAVAEHELADFVAGKAATVAAVTDAGGDPLDDLHAGWRTYVAFGLAHPSLFRFLSDPERVGRSAAARSGLRVLAARIQRVAAAGRLRVDEQQAAALVHAAGVGTVTTLLATPPDDRDDRLADAMYQAVLAGILTDAPARDDDDVRTATIAFRAVAPQLDELTAAERTLLADWLDRVLAARR